MPKEGTPITITRHGDPADRLPVAAAWVLGVPFVIADRGILAWHERDPGGTATPL